LFWFFSNSKYQNLLRTGEICNNVHHSQICFVNITNIFLRRQSFLLPYYPLGRHPCWIQHIFSRVLIDSLFNFYRFYVRPSIMIFCIHFLYQNVPDIFDTSGKRGGFMIRSFQISSYSMCISSTSNIWCLNKLDFSKLSFWLK